MTASRSPDPKAPAAGIRPLARLNLHWLRSIGFTVGLVGLIAAAIGADWSITLGSLVTCTLGFGFFYLLFPGGAQFGTTVANFLAIYACMFEFFRSSNFPDAPSGLTLAALGLPVLGFLGRSFLRRRQVVALIRARRLRALQRLPPVSRWFLGVVAVGAASFGVPRLALDPLQQGLMLLGGMAVITGFVVMSVRDIVLVMIDIAMVFEGVAARIDRLVMPMLAFLTFYSLLVVIFGCLYRIADVTAAMPQFMLHGSPGRVSFNDMLYYSVATITTLGFGDITPISPLVRALTAVEVVSGVLMLLFGFSEIMRSAGPDRTRQPAERPRVLPEDKPGHDP